VGNLWRRLSLHSPQVIVRPEFRKRVIWESDKAKRGNHARPSLCSFSIEEKDARLAGLSPKNSCQLSQNLGLSLFQISNSTIKEVLFLPFGVTSTAAPHSVYPGLSFSTLPMLSLEFPKWLKAEDWLRMPGKQSKVMSL
jgi:hypothetical protein